MKIEGRTFLVSGGASGLGRACVESICKQGGYVAILDMSEQLGREVVENISSGRSKFFSVDVTQTDSITAVIKDINIWVQETRKPIGGVIAAAGVPNPGKIIDKDLNPLSLDDFDFVLNVNVRGTVDLIRQVLPDILRTEPVGEDGERGIIVMVSSAAAFDGQTGQVAYAASKGALASLTLPMSRDLSRYGVRVVTIAPGLFDSGMTKLMSEKVRKSISGVLQFPVRYGRPYEFAQLVTQSIENVMLNGVVLRLDGGIRLPGKL